MIPAGSRGNTAGFKPLPSPEDHGDSDCVGGGALGGIPVMSCGSSWVWPPPKIKNYDEGTCSCVVSQIQQQQQQQQQQPRMENNPKALRFLFCKELTHSDIKKRNKIIVPRRDAEIHFPSIESREGVRLYMEDKETRETWCFRFRYRITNNSKVHSLEGTRQFLQVHGMKAGDYIVIYKDDERRRYVIGVSKDTREALYYSSVTTGSVVSNLGIKTSSSYTYFNQLSDFSIVDEMEEVATPRTPYPYGNATCNGDLVSCELERLPPLKTFKFFDLPIDYIFWI